LFVMVAPTFVDLQGFIVGRRFVVKEVAVSRKKTILSHYIFANPLPWNLLTKSEKSCFSWLVANHQETIIDCNGKMVQYGETIDYNGRDWYRRGRRRQ